MRRIHAIDMLRGMVMVLMILDHTRNYFGGAPFNPTDVTQTTIAWFYTRWITHFCAPAFILLAGTSAYMSSARTKGIGELRKFLAVRGLWLIFLELTWVRFSWAFDFNFGHCELGVIWAIGVSMLALALVVSLPTWAVGALGTVIVLTHNMYDGVHSTDLGAFAPVWKLLHEFGPLMTSEPISVFVYYPLIPWIGVIFLGYCLGALWDYWGENRTKRLLQLGVFMYGAFIVLRGLNFYGDPNPWIFHEDKVMTALSYLNVTKYPPSLSYLLMTLGPALILLSFFTVFNHEKSILTKFGQVPLFIYLVHIPLIHILAHIAIRMDGSTAWEFGTKKPMGVGFELWGVYLATVIIILMLIPLSNWFGKLKMSKAHPILRFL